MNSTLWILWWQLVKELRPAFSRERTFHWGVVVLIGLSIRQELYGVTSLLRAVGLSPKYYQRLLDTFCSSGINLQKLSRYWLLFLLRKGKPFNILGRIVLVVDGIKVGKTGKKMPAVKRTVQTSENNTKPTSIMAHSLQQISILMKNPAGAVTAIPIAARIHEGLKWSNFDTRSLLDKLIGLIKEVADLLPLPALILADAYYAAGNFAKPLLQTEAFHLLTRVRHNAVAFRPLPDVAFPRGRGRPKKYGKKYKLWDFFDDESKFIDAPSPIPGESSVTIQYFSIRLLWKRLGEIVQFILVNHPTRGKMILITTNLYFEPLDAILSYYYRFRIEVSFKQAIHTLGAFAYHFWMKTMKPITKYTTTQYLHRASQEYKEKIKEKIHAYHVHINLAGIAQGLMLYLSLYNTSTVWQSFRGWLRTIRKGVNPSELVVSNSLRDTYWEFLASKELDPAFEKFITKRLKPERIVPIRLFGT
jgi:hypothetical protein